MVFLDADINSRIAQDEGMYHSVCAQKVVKCVTWGLGCGDDNCKVESNVKGLSLRHESCGDISAIELRSGLYNSHGVLSSR